VVQAYDPVRVDEDVAAALVDLFAGRLLRSISRPYAIQVAGPQISHQEPVSIP